MEKDKLIRIDRELLPELKKIAKYNDRTIPRQVNRFLKKSIQEYKEAHPEVLGSGDETTGVTFLKLNKILTSNEEKDQGKKLNVLCVEDHKDHGETLKLLVEHFGHKSVIIDNPKDAIKTVKAGDTYFDAAIIDYHLPGNMNGKELMLELQKIKPEINCIILTADTRDIIRNSFKKLDKKPYGFANKLQGPEVLKKWLTELAAD
jgi:CheY-like chemotaxis protein